MNEIKELEDEIKKMKLKLKNLKEFGNKDLNDKIQYGKAPMCKFCVYVTSREKYLYLRELYCEKHGFITKSYNICKDVELDPNKGWMFNGGT